MKEAARVVRDLGYRFVRQRLGRQKTVVLQGVRLALDHPTVSPRMFYLMCQDYEIRDVRLASRVTGSASRVLELGAGAGFMAIYWRRAGVADYAMVEASPVMPALIETNFRLNGLDPAATLLIRAAVAAGDGSADFYVSRNFWSSGTVGRGGERKVTVPALCLPSILARLPFVPDTLIVDVEGSELAIAPEDYARFRNLVLETHPGLPGIGQERVEGLLAALKGQGFRVLEREGDSYVMTRDGSRSSGR